MKSQSQILAYLGDSRPKREIDELAIRQYCVNFGIDLSKCDVSPRNMKKPAITYRQFKSWLGNDNFEKGEIITLDSDGSIGLVRYGNAESIAFHAMLSVSGELRLSVTLGHCAYHSSSAKERVRLQRALSAHNLIYLRRNNILVDKVLPGDGNYVQITRLGQKTGVGIFRRINDQGKTIFHFLVNTKTGRHYVDKTYRHYDDCQLTNATSKDKENINNILKQEGWVWDGYSKKLVINGLRRYKGGTYFYINSYLKVITAIDNYSKTDLMRFRAKNYFVQSENALDLIKTVFCNPLAANSRQKIGGRYFYLDSHLKVMEVSDYRKIKDTKRFEVGNYFLDESIALNCQNKYLELREVMLRQIPTNLLKLKPKKGRKPKNKESFN